MEGTGSRATGAASTRRQLLCRGVALGIGLAVAPLAAAAEPRLPRSLRRLSTAIAAEPWARELGRRFLQRHPEEADLATLQRRLSVPNHPSTWGGWRRHVARARRDDLRAGRTIELDGWVLTTTEARLLALARLCTP